MMMPSTVESSIVCLSVFAVGIAAAAAGCSGPEGCGSDTDCRGERICNLENRCVYPETDGGPSGRDTMADTADDPEDARGTDTADPGTEDTGSDTYDDPSDTGGSDTTVADTGMATSDGGTPEVSCRPLSLPEVRGTNPAEGGASECYNCLADRFRRAEVVNCSNQADRRPDRCDKTPAETDWGAGSVITSFEMTSEEAQDCCFNLDDSDDDSNDNGLATLLSFLPGVDFETEHKKELVSGNFAVLAEYQGLTDFGQNEDFSVQVTAAKCGTTAATRYMTKQDASCDFSDSACTLEASAGESFQIDPDSFDEGTQAKGYLESGQFSDGRLEAGPGVIMLKVPRTPGLRIDGATIEAEVDRAASDLAGDGVVVTQGKLGGYVLLEDLVGMLNDGLSSCDCLDNPAEAVTTPTTDPDNPDLKPEGCYDGTRPEDECEVTCREEVEMKSGECGSDASGFCAESDTICSSVGLLVDSADMDVDGDGNKDALSVGALFEMTSANIDGVAE